MTIAFLFPGQGSQSVGMGRELAHTYDVAGNTFQEADGLLGYSFSSRMWDGPEADLNDTANTQPALYIHSIAALRVVAWLFPDLRPAFVAGHSLGELTALTAASALPFDAGLRLVRLRGELMKQAGEQSPGGMAAILGLDIPTLEQICGQSSQEDGRVQIANDNCPGQVVISGAKPSLDRAVELAKQAGARRALPLAVSVATHSYLMESAQSGFWQAVDEAPIAHAHIPVVGNVSAAGMNQPDELRVDLRAQLTSRVRWTESIRWMIEQGVTHFIELGNGSVLTGLLKRIDANVSGISFGAPADLERFREFHKAAI